MRTFRPKLWTSLLTLIACVVFGAAGLWQLDRAEQRAERFSAMQAGLEASARPLVLPIASAAPIAWSKAVVRGRFDPAATVYIDNRVLDGRAGYHIIAALKPEGQGRHVLINRGWIDVGPDRSTLPIVPTPNGVVTIEGIITEPPQRTFELGNVDPKSPVWPNLLLERFGVGRGLSVEPLVLLQTSVTDDPLIRRWALPASGAEKNKTYALQWFSFAAITLVLYAIFSFRRKSG